ncbi:hypothetical protein SALBM311S_06291 [Streptomyces alboniger]
MTGRETRPLRGRADITRCDAPRRLTQDAIPPGHERPELLARNKLNFSTWRGVHGIYLEDLYVRPTARGAGHGKALLTELARISVDRGYARLEWAVLNWNAPAIDFYEALGARPQDEWTVYRLTDEALVKVSRMTPH